jgi:GNAT superfamily N-acetyltransferase
MVTIALAVTDEEIRRCYGVLVQLRPHLGVTQLVAQVRRQQKEGYHLAYLAVDGVVRSVAGYRYGEYLAWGRILYVDDLVSDAAVRGSGCGQQLIEWLMAQARAQGCDQFHLDSGVQRHGAHRFYLARGLDITCHHFALKLK